jgi:hypothetical protein
VARCHYCKSIILFGGVTQGGARYCNENCSQWGGLISAAQQLPEDLVAEHLSAVHQGNCPKCGESGPVDFHTSYVVWSAIAITTWKTRPLVCCRRCGFRSKLDGVFFSGFAGWWSLHGIIITPIMILSNIVGMIVSPNPATPSAKLEQFVRVNLAAQIAHAGRQPRVET